MTEIDEKFVYGRYGNGEGVDYTFYIIDNKVTTYKLKDNVLAIMTNSVTAKELGRIDTAKCDKKLVIKLLMECFRVNEYKW